MSRAHEIYPLEHCLERELSHVKNDEHNSDILTRYYKVRSTEVSLATLWTLFYRLRVMSEILGKKFEKATKEDIENLHFEICRKWKHPNTRNKFRKTLKKFYQWLEGCAADEYPPRVKWIRTEKVPIVTVTENDMIPHEDALRVCECADNLRDKALFSGKLDAGCRIGEILTVRVGEVRMTEYGAVLDADGKTGRQPLILTWATPYLTQWLNNHPFRDNPKAPLFCDLTKAEPTQLSYAGARKAFKKAVKKTGISKRVWFHLFKHVSSSYDAANGMPDPFRKYKHHWSPNSKMSAVYEHLSQSITLKIQKDTWSRMPGGARPETHSDENLKPSLVKMCSRCKFENPSNSIYCNRCGFSINAGQASKIAVARQMAEDLLNRLTEDPKKLEKLLALVES